MSYCRDAGGAGTADDLPAIYSDNTVIRGRDLKCIGGSNNNEACYNDTDCPGGRCSGLLKEFYFFREGEQTAPSAGGFTVSALPQGGAVSASWSTVTGAVGYKVYYGTASGNYTASVDAGAVLSKDITGLTNGQIYYFALTSYNAKKVESEYSEPKSATPYDSQGPTEPTSFNATPKNKQVELSWVDNDSTAVNYRVFYKASDICGDTVSFGSSIPTASKTATVSNLANGIKYCFGVVAYDSYGNKSATTTAPAMPVAQ